MSNGLFPKTLRRHRLMLGLTQTDMAERLHTPFRTYQDWEAGKVTIPGAVFLALEALVDNADPVAEDYCWVAGHRKRPTRGWVIQDTRTKGQVALFWAQGEGYTTDLREARVFTKEQAFEQHAQRGSDVPRPLKDLVSLAQASIPADELSIGGQ